MEHQDNMEEKTPPAPPSNLLGAVEKKGPLDPETHQPKIKYPKSVFFIVSNEFCERFCYYGMRTILALYLHQQLGYSEDTSTTIYHAFVSFAYFTPVLGAMIADSWLGKFNTILYLSCIYACGSIILSLAAMPGALPMEAFTFVGLILIGFGTGGIKPCVSSFGGEQFVVPEQELQLQQFFSVFYFAVNGGSLLSTFITPILREDVHCFGDENCYPLAFGVPAILMVVSIIIFVAGSSLYKKKQPEGNVVLKVSRCIGTALKKKFNDKGPKREHWLDYAEVEYGSELVSHIKMALNVLTLFIPLPVFWALFDQQGSRWLFQGTRMDGDFNGFSLYPDQIQVFNPALVMILIPLFETVLYPTFRKCNFLVKPLRRMTVGGLLAALAFIMSALVELSIKPSLAVVPDIGEAQLSIANNINCNLTLTFNGLPEVTETTTVGPLEVWYRQHLAVQGSKNFDVTVTPVECVNFANSKTFSNVLQEEKATTFTIYDDESTELNLLGPFSEDLEKSNSGDSKVRILFDLNSDDNVTLIFTSANGKRSTKFFLLGTDNNTEVQELPYGQYTVEVDEEDGGGFSEEVYLNGGGVYYYVFTQNDAGQYLWKLNTMTQPNTVNILWQIPQYIVITSGEVMFSITGLEFAFTQAPLTMKSVLASGWLLTVAFGNIIVIIIAEAKFFEDPMYEFILFAGLMALSMLVFFLMSLRYKYVSVSSEDSNLAPINEKKKDKESHDNNAFDAHRD